MCALADTLAGAVDAGIRSRRTTGSTRTAHALNSAVPDFGSGRVDGEQVRRHVVGEVQRHEHDARAQRRGRSRRRLDAAAPRVDAHQVAVSMPSRSASSGEMSSVSPECSGES